MDYYKDLILNIENKLKEEKYSEAETLINEELALPYVPKDILEKLHDLKHFLPNDHKNKLLSDEEIASYLKGDPYHQLIAVDYLDMLNLRNYYDICNDFLKSKGFINAKVLLIASLISQQISDEYDLNKDDLEYRFIPRYCMLPEESTGYNAALKILSDYYMKEPSSFLMAKDLLYKECFMYLPLSYDEDEADIIANNIISYLDDVLNNDMSAKEELKN